MRDDKLVRINLSDGAVTPLFAASGVSKLVGVYQDDPDSIVVLTDEIDGAHQVEELSLRTGKPTRIRYDPGDASLVTSLSGSGGDYGDVTVMTEVQAEKGKGIWTDVFLHQKGQPPRNLSRCKGDLCGQPALSLDGSQAAFLRKAR